jgi:hypothetical protein
MAGGMLSLIAFGAQDILLKGNPQTTYFKKVFKTHTNFSMESIALNFSRTDTNIYENTTFTTKIDRHGDLINHIYFSMELPDIISDSRLSFRWVENLAEALINNYSITINGSLIERNYGENLFIQNNLCMNEEKRKVYNKLTGNIDELTNPEKYVLDNTQISNPTKRYRIGGTYPTATIDPLTGNPVTVSIKNRRIYIPLPFWFSKDIAASLPLISLQYSETVISVEINPISNIYRLLYNRDGLYDYWAPDMYNFGHRLVNFVTNMNSTYLTSETSLDIKAYLEVNYVFLEELERNFFAYKPLDYLIEQTTRVEYNDITVNSVQQLVIQNPIKEIYWFLRRSDHKKKNNPFDFTDKSRQIMKTGKIQFNGLDRISEKDAIYFNYLQPYQHHSGNCVDGLYNYSFSVLPELYAPSGSVNASRINKFSFPLYIMSPDTIDYTYDIVFYVISNNFIKISSGLCGVVFAL